MSDDDTDNNQGTYAYRLKLCEEIIDLCNQLLAMGCNPKFVSEEDKDKVAPKREYVFRAEKRRREKERNNRA